jgi:glucokinase
VVEAIVGTVDALTTGRDRGALLGCGIAVPGWVDPDNDTVSGDSRLGWQQVPLQALLEARLNLPVLVTDRGKAAGLGEMWVLGKERSHDLIYLYLGTGVAGAVVLGRDVHWGVSNLAGEIGHMTVDPNGPRCSCGNRGCLEALVSTRAILDGLPAGQTVAEIGVAAESGDAVPLARVTQTARWLAIAISNLINTLNPAVIVLGGPTASWGAVLTDAIDREIEARALPQSRRAARVVIGQAREQAAPLGAAVLVLRQAAELITEPKLASRAVRA